MFVFGIRMELYWEDVDFLKWSESTRVSKVLNVPIISFLLVLHKGGTKLLHFFVGVRDKIHMHLFNEKNIRITCFEAILWKSYASFTYSVLDAG